MKVQLNILTLEGYYERYFELVQSNNSRKAWEKLENELKDQYNITRYTSFESFVSAKNRRIRGRNKHLP